MGKGQTVPKSSHPMRLMNEKPGSFEEIQSVALLRTIKKSVEEVAEILHLGKKKILDIENYVKGLDWEDVEVLFSTDRLKQVCTKKLPDLENLNKNDLVLAAYVTTDEILQYFREDDYLKKNRPPNSKANSGTVIDSITRNSWKEHQDNIGNLARRLRDELRAPVRTPNERNLRNKKYLVSGQEGVYQIGEESKLIWQFVDKIKILLCYPLEYEADAKTKNQTKYLKEHLSTSSYSWIFDDKEKGIDKWKQLGGDQLEARSRFLNRIDRKVTKITNMEVGDSGRKDPGPTYWFSESILGSTLDSLYQNLNYDKEFVNEGIFKIRYGPAVIAIVRNEEEAQKCQESHSNLMENFSRSTTAKSIRTLKRQWESVAGEIQNALAAFAAEDILPGKCSCSTCHK